MLVSTFITLASLLAASATPLASRQADVDPNQAAIDTWMDDTSNTTTLVIGTRFYIKEPVDKLDKRDCVPSHFNTNNVDRTGTWWGEWAKVSSCIYNNLGAGEAEFTMSTSQTITQTISGGFNTGLGSAGDMAKVINGNGGLSLGYSWSTAKTTGFSFNCHIPAGKLGSVWQQNLMGWADTAQRRCTRGCGENGCSDWSFGHIDFPLAGGSQTNQNLGCSSGSASGCN
jgi:hypothetical protein